MKKKIGMIIQARMSSKRFPGKVMKRILNIPMIYRIYERVILCRKLDDVIVAIPSSKSDDKLEIFLKKKKIKTFRGSENNLISRYFKAAKLYNLDYIVRLPADNPLPDFKEIDRLINFHMKIKDNINVFSTNLQPIKNSNYIDGIGAEILSYKMLEKIFKNKNLQKSKEHLSLNFYDFEKKKIINKNFFRVCFPISPKSIAYPNIVLDVNFKKQFDLINRIYSNLYKKNKNFLTKDIVNFLKKNEKHLFKNN
jgi:spore coat polysaccharide biosynthesis protein SpsF